jgi:hypothetical protein
VVLALLPWCALSVMHLPLAAYRLKGAFYMSRGPFKTLGGHFHPPSPDVTATFVERKIPRRTAVTLDPNPW